MSSVSAGILLYRWRGGQLQVLLVHPGGPFWARRDLGAWSIPKGECDRAEEEPLAAARREFAEELGSLAPTGEAIDLGEVVQRAGKRVRAFALAGNLDAASIRSSTFELEWPPRSGRRAAFPEVDRAGWFGFDEASAKLNPGQRELLGRLQAALAAGARSGSRESTSGSASRP